MVWYLNTPWDRIIIGITLVVLAVFLFWQHLVAYERIYFPARAVGLAAVKTVYWLACYSLSFGAVYVGVSRVHGARRSPLPGRGRDLVGGVKILNVLVWKPVSRAIDKLLG